MRLGGEEWETSCVSHVLEAVVSKLVEIGLSRIVFGVQQVGWVDSIPTEGDVVPVSNVAKVLEFAAIAKNGAR